VAIDASIFFADVFLCDDSFFEEALIQEIGQRMAYNENFDEPIQRSEQILRNS